MESLKVNIAWYLKSVLNSYAILFFSQDRVLAVLLLLVSFLNPPAGLTGLLSVSLANGIVALLGFNRESTKMGLYGFNALLLGIAFGTFYHFNASFAVWLMAACLLAVTLTVVLSSWLLKYGLPVLSVPFIVSFWLVLLAADNSPGLGLQQKESYILAELYTGANTSLVNFLKGIDKVCFGHYPDLFFRALSSIFFQNSVIAGFLMAIGLFIHSRIGFSLLIAGFVTACVFNSFTGVYPEGLSHYHLGANFMMTALAIGGFFLVPSGRSYLWAVVSVPLTFLLVSALSKILGIYNLPVFSLPFCLLTNALLYFFMLREKPGQLQLTPIQHYSPEINLYQYLNGRERLQELQYLRLDLPFMSEWLVWQGYDGGITHKDGWGKALDFVIADAEGQTFSGNGSRPEQFYCFNKPVLACADGVVEEVINHIEDNVIGVVNTAQNWGNTVLIRHAAGLYTQLSHLKQHSIKVKPGEQVKQGDLIGLCGNSGRSPEPHLHFQAQVTANIGSKTLQYPFACYTNIDAFGTELLNFSIPKQGNLVRNITVDNQLKQAFRWQPGYTANLTGANGNTERMEVFTDAYNQLYFLSHDTGAVLYFVNNGTMFYCTAFYGTDTSLLYYFYLAAYKVVFTTEGDTTASDSFPLQLRKIQPGIWFHDLVAPFRQFIKRCYQSKSSYRQQQLVIQSNAYKQVFKKQTEMFKAEISVSANTITNFSIKINQKDITVQWHSENTF